MTQSELIIKVNQAYHKSNGSFLQTTVFSAASAFGVLLALGGVTNPGENYDYMVVGGGALAVVSVIGAISGLKKYFSYKKEYKNLENKLKKI